MILPFFTLHIHSTVYLGISTFGSRGGDGLLCTVLKKARVHASERCHKIQEFKLTSNISPITERRMTARRSQPHGRPYIWFAGERADSITD